MTDHLKRTSTTARPGHAQGLRSHRQRALHARQRHGHVRHRQLPQRTSTPLLERLASASARSARSGRLRRWLRERLHPRSAFVADHGAPWERRVAYLTHEAAAAFMAMNAGSRSATMASRQPPRPRTAYRLHADQLYFWNQYLHHGGNLGARARHEQPRALAVDLATEQMRRSSTRSAGNGAAKERSDAQSEWWHLRYRLASGNGNVGDPITGSPGRPSARRSYGEAAAAPSGKSVSVNGQVRSSAGSLPGVSQCAISCPWTVNRARAPGPHYGR